MRMFSERRRNGLKKGRIANEIIKRKERYRCNGERCASSHSARDHLDRWYQCFKRVHVSCRHRNQSGLIVNSHT